MTNIDTHNREISYLRISVTDRCNLRCFYCLPEQGIRLKNHDDILSFEKITRAVEAAGSLGIRSFRLTGGEPLVRLGMVDLVRMIREFPFVDDLSMTTNGTFLAKYTADLATAGLSRVNVSLDTLDASRFTRYTRGGCLTNVLEGIEEAQKSRLTPVKINVVLIGGRNDDEVTDFANKTITDGWHVRFIELMPIGPAKALPPSCYVNPEEAKSKIESVLGKLVPAQLTGNGPANYWRLPNAEGTIGFINPISNCFCQNCNRLRLTSDGKLIPCLLSDIEVDIKNTLRRGRGTEEIRELFRQAIAKKPVSHGSEEEQVTNSRLMSGIGG